MAVVGFLPRLLRRVRGTDGEWVGAGSLKRQLDQDRGPLVIDVRGAEEFTGQLGHIPAAHNIPLSDLPARLAQLEPARSRGLTLVCRTDKRSAKAAKLLRRAGFADVTILRGGMEEWNRQGFEIAHYTHS